MITLEAINEFLSKWNGIISIIVLALLSVYAVYEIHTTTFENLKECSEQYKELYYDYVDLWEYTHSNCNSLPQYLKTNVSKYNVTINIYMDGGNG